ncbi:MAG: class I SAM-dependent methyltransferase [Verrucomicrobiota bacterium]
MSDPVNPAEEMLNESIVIPSRREFNQLLESKGLLAKGVEIGVCEGEYSRHILSTWKGERLYSIDPWKEFGEEYRDINNAPQNLHDQRYEGTKEKLSVFGKRSVIIRKTSLEAAAIFGVETMDFIYLDAQHNYDAIKADIEAWYPKVKKGGVLGGHDYLDGVFIGGIFGVRRAVREFALEKKLEILISGEGEDESPSWFVVKS